MNVPQPYHAIIRGPAGLTYAMCVATSLDQARQRIMDLERVAERDVVLIERKPGWMPYQVICEGSYYYCVDARSGAKVSYPETTQQAADQSCATLNMAWQEAIAYNSRSET